MVVPRGCRRVKVYIMEQEIRIKGLDSDKRSKIRFEFKSEVKIREFLNVWLRAGVRKEVIDKWKRKSHSMLDNF